MSVFNNLAIICNLYEKCNGDLEKTKRTYKTVYGRHITDRHIMKALTRKITDPAVKEAQVEYKDCNQVEVEEEKCEVDIIDCFEDPFSEDQKLTCTKVDPKLVFYPIVYTSRLEDMHIFNNNFENIPLSSIVEQVEAESKPSLISDTLFQRRTFIKNSIRFDELVNKLERFNAAATTGAFQNSDETNYGLISYVKTEPEEFSNDINILKDRSLNDNNLDGRCRTASGHQRRPAKSPQPRLDSMSESENSTEATNQLETPIKTNPLHRSNNNICNKTEQIKPSTSNNTFKNINQTNNGPVNSIETEPEEFLNDIILDKLEKFKASTSTNTFNSKESNIGLIISKRTESEDVLSNNEIKDSLKDKIRKLCKPLSVKLVDCKYLLKVKKSHKLCRRHKQSPLADSVRSCSKCVKTPIKDDFKFVRAFKIGEKAKKFWIVMKNLYMKTTEIYKMRRDHGIPIVYCRIGHVITDDRELALYITDSIAILELSNCCWLRRYANNKKTFYGTGTPNIWSQPHPCPHNKCICCCRDTISVEISDKTLKTSFSVVKAKLTNQGNPSSIPVKEVNNAINVINKALVYKRLPKPAVVKAVDNQPYSFFYIRVKNECDNSMQQYIVRLDGQVQTYIKFSRQNFRMTGLHMELTKSYDIHKSFNTMTCCWVTYRNFLTNIVFKSVPVSYNFLVAPHPCRSENCKCCCKLLKSYRKFQFKPLVLPKTLSHTKRSTTKYKANLSILNTIKHNKIEICTSKKCLAECETTVKANQQTSEPVRQRVWGRPPVSVVPVALLQTTESKLNQPTLPVPQVDDPTVSTMISTILDRFKNIRLTLNPNGKVTAELDTPVNDLTTDELKILSNILNHAQNQVNALGITNDGNSSISYPIVSGGYSGVCIPGQANDQVADASTSTSQFPAVSKLPTITIDGTDEFEDTRKLLQETVYKNSLSTDLYDTYSKLTYFKNKQYRRSLQAFTKVEEKSSSLPQIQNTFSLNQVDKPIDKAYIKLGGSRKRKQQSCNSNTNHETASSVAKLPKPVTDIKIVNVRSRSFKNNPNTRPVAPPPPFMAQPGVPPLHYPYTAPMIINNATDIQTPMPNMPHQIHPHGAIIQPVILPNNFTNKPVPPLAPMVNNQTHLIEPIVKPESEPILVDDDADDDCILGF